MSKDEDILECRGCGSRFGEKPIVWCDECFNDVAAALWRVRICADDPLLASILREAGFSEEKNDG